MTDQDTSLAGAAHRALAERIVTLQLPPGQAITEKELAAALGMGRTPVREAIQRLAEDGLIVVRPRQGLTIAEIDAADFGRVLEARAGLDELLSAAAARGADDATRAALGECASGLAAAAKAGDAAAVIEADRRAAELVGRASGNRFAAQAAAPLLMHTRRFWFRLHGPADIEEMARRTRRLVEEIVAAKPQRAARRAARLLRYFEEMAALGRRDI